MDKIGKIAAYNQATGEGVIIIKETNEKVDFTIKEWIDTEVLPEFNLEVEILENGYKRHRLSANQNISQKTTHKKSRKKLIFILLFLVVLLSIVVYYVYIKLMDYTVKELALQYELIQKYTQNDPEKIKIIKSYPDKAHNVYLLDIANGAIIAEMPVIKNGMQLNATGINLVSIDQNKVQQIKQKEQEEREKVPEGIDEAVERAIKEIGKMQLEITKKKLE